MILHALKEYYDRKAADPDSIIAPSGWERKELPFLLSISRDCNFVGIVDTRETDGKKLRAKTFLLPAGVKRANNIAANLLWDNLEYALGISSPGKTNPGRVREQHLAFLDRLQTLQCSTAQIVGKFLADSAEAAKVQEDSLFEELLKSNPFVSFQIAGSKNPVFNEADFQQEYSQQSVSEQESSFCLVSGEKDVIARLHTAIKGVRGAQSTGGNIVSFNFDAAESYGKKQGLNSPVGEKAMFAYTTALNTLLGKDSLQKITVGDATTVFWTSQASPLEADFAAFWEEPPKENPDQLSQAVRALFESVQSGSFFVDQRDTRFYILGLAPNAARLSIRFWEVKSVAEIATGICHYFEDLRIIHGPREQDDLSLWRLLLSTAPLAKNDNINPALAAELLRSILRDSPFPLMLLQAVLLRCKIEHEVTYPRAKLIKACLNRSAKNERSLKMSLDRDNDHIGYRLGRLFAVLEKIQQEASSNVNAGIREKFYASASSSPVTVFGNLMRLKNHHLDKLSDGRRINFERLIGEIIYHSTDKTGIQAFPAHLNLDEQGRFAIGYYHQMQEFYRKKEEESTEKNS